MALPVAAIRREFPILARRIGGQPIAYLDSAATAQKPRAVIAAMERFLTTENANVHRGMHILAEEATVAYETARAVVQRFIGAASPNEIVFTKSATEAINLVARSYGDAFLREGDAVLLTPLEHHSNIVPWMQLRERRGIDVRWTEIADDGTVLLSSVDDALRDGRVKLVAVTGLSNVLGVMPPLQDIGARARRAGAAFLVDAAQLITHAPVDVADIDCDFLAFSGHKLYGPTGIGVLYGKNARLEKMPPMLGGGMMIRSVTRDGFTAADTPQRFEAGTPAIAEAVGLAAAIEWLRQFSWTDVISHEQTLLSTAADTLRSLSGLRLLGPYSSSLSHFPSLPCTGACLSFTFEDIHPHDLTAILGAEGICLRAGHHCAQVLHSRLGIIASTRLSLGIYNTIEEISRLVPAITAAGKMLRR